MKASAAAPSHREGLTAATKPFLKWAGGKRRLLPELHRSVPARWNRYYEPFLGGGALYFSMPQPDSFLSDVNMELVSCYSVVRDKPEQLIEHLSTHVYSQEHYQWVRALNPDVLTDVERASRFVYLNRTCFNGLWRVNRRGEFNTPMGRYANPRLVPAPEIRAASGALQGCHLSATGFREAVTDCRSGDLVYFDPPYVPAGGYADFDRYHAGCFGMADHQDLADLAHELDGRGCQVLLSNSDMPLVRRLYSGWQITTISAPRSINCVGSRRGPVAELIITNYRPVHD